MVFFLFDKTWQFHCMSLILSMLTELKAVGKICCVGTIVNLLLAFLTLSCVFRPSVLSPKNLLALILTVGIITEHITLGNCVES